MGEKGGKKAKNLPKSRREIHFWECFWEKEEIKEYQCNVLLEGLEIGEYSSNFLCVKENGDMMVRECVERRYLMKPMTVKLLDASWEYWTRRGIEDWGGVKGESGDN